jgi:hypothetical protein
VDHRHRHNPDEIGDVLVVLGDVAPAGPNELGVVKLREPPRTIARQASSPIGGPPGEMPARSPDETYYLTVRRSTPRLQAAAACERPEYP